jgi:chaperonin GroES
METIIATKKAAATLENPTDGLYYQHSLAMSANNLLSRILQIVEAPPAAALSRRRKFMKIRPLHDRVIVKRVEAERVTASGIVIPDTAGEKPDQGEVIAVGNGKIMDDGKVRPMAVKAGDRVLFGKYSGQTVKVEGEELLVMREEDIMGVVEA